MPGCSLLAALILSAMLVSDAMALSHHGRSRDEEVMVQMLQAFVATLGFWPTIAFVVLLGATGASASGSTRSRASRPRAGPWSARSSSAAPAGRGLGERARLGGERIGRLAHREIVNRDVEGPERLAALVAERHPRGERRAGMNKFGSSRWIVAASDPGPEGSRKHRISLESS